MQLGAAVRGCAFLTHIQCPRAPVVSHPAPQPQAAAAARSGRGGGTGGTTQLILHVADVRRAERCEHRLWHYRLYNKRCDKGKGKGKASKTKNQKPKMGENYTISRIPAIAIDKHAIVDSVESQIDKHAI